MQRKTQPFDREFYRQFKLLKSSLSEFEVKGKLKGSYTNKQLGSLVTDIDIQFTTPLESVPQVMSTIIKTTFHKDCSFIFVALTIGLPDLYKPPWTFTEDCQCLYNPYTSREWIEKLYRLEVLRPPEYEWVNETIFGSYVTIGNLLRVADMVSKKGALTWDLEDIQKGYKDITVPGDSNPSRFNLLEIVAEEYPVMEMAFVYENIYVGIDVAVVSNQHVTDNLVGMKKFYMADYYKIVKGLHWRIPEELKPLYNSTMSLINWLASAKAIISMLQNMEQTNRINPDELAYQLEETMDDYGNHDFKYNPPRLKDLKSSISYKIDQALLDDPHVSSYIESCDMGDRWEKGLVSLIPVSHQTLIERFEAGNVYLFGHPKEVEACEKIRMVSRNIQNPVHKTLHCIVTTVQILSLDMESVLKNIPETKADDNKFEVVENYISSLYLKKSPPNSPYV